MKFKNIDSTNKNKTKSKGESVLLGNATARDHKKRLLGALLYYPSGNSPIERGISHWR
jgi:hypothetical protein